MPPTAPHPVDQGSYPPAPWGQSQPWGQPQQSAPDWHTGRGAFQPSGGLGVAVMVLSSLLTVTYWGTAALASSADQAREKAIIQGVDPDELITGYGLVSLLSFPILLAAGILTCVWLARARENALLLNPTGQRRGKAWVWLGWFIPIVQLWFPKQILDDTIKATAPAAGVREPISTVWYWTAWIVTDVLTGTQSFLSLQAAPEDAVNPGLEFAVAAAATVALVFWLILVRRISAVQDQLAANGAVGSGGPVPPRL
jgi:hypothetical protein